MKRIISLFIFFQISYIVFAETQNYLPGYIITLKQDIVYGQINFKTDYQNAKECRFRLNDNAREELYLPGDITGYRFSGNGKYYVSRKITIDGKESTVFLEYLIQGLMNVYYYSVSDMQSYYFFEKEDGTMQMITKNAETIEDMKVIEDKQYDGKLRYIFQNYIPKEYSNKLINYNQKTMIDIAMNYHNALCTTGGECIVFENKQPDAQILNLSFGVYGGINVAEYSIYKLLFYRNGLYVQNNNKIKSINPVIGVIANIFYPRWSKSFSLLLDMSATKMNAPKRYVFNDVVESQLQGYLFESKIGVKYTYPKYKIRPIAEIGFGYTKLLSSEASVYYHYAPMVIEDYYMKNKFYGIYGGIGIDYKLNKRNFLFFRVSSNWYAGGENPGELNGSDKFKDYQIKAGYIF